MRTTFFKISKKSFIAVLIASAVLVAAFFVAPAAKPAFAAESTVHTYAESTDVIVNPAAGFYKRVTVKLSRNSSGVNPSVESDIAKQSQHYGIIQLCFDLADFSGNAGGVDAEIDVSALSAVQKVFGYLRKYKVGAIVRFDYNRNGLQDSAHKYLNREPSLDMVLNHVQNVASVISQYSDVILGVESGMLGPWGEQHSTTLASSGADTYYNLVQAWLDNTPSTIGVTVRRPLYFTYWANKAFNLNLSVSDLADFDASAYLQAGRVGVFNDGYLGSATDLGTFTDRAAETAFIGKQAEHTYYGGELVADGSLGGVVGNYNSVSNLEQEGFVTHTSYLNRDWNDKVFDAYAKTTYIGNDPLYNGKTDELTFVNNRLGYRFYLSESYDAVVNQAGEASLKFTIANAGFARILCPSTSVLVFTNGTNTATVNCNVDLSQIPSAQSVTNVGTKTFNLSASIPDELPDGNYDVYLRFYTEYGAEIRMANDLSICATDRNGVKIASVEKSTPVTLSGIAVTTQPAKTVYTVGESIDLTGLVVTATYSDGTTAPVNVTTSMLSGYDMSTAGTKTVTVTYVEEDVTTTATFTFTVNAVTISKIDVTTPPTKTVYTVGEPIDITGLVVTATYSDGTTAQIEVTADMLVGYDTSTAGKQTVTVTYLDKAVSFRITVNAAHVTDPSQTPPDNTSSLDTKKVVIICVAAAIVIAGLVLAFGRFYKKKK